MQQSKIWSMPKDKVIYLIKWKKKNKWKIEEFEAKNEVEINKQALSKVLVKESQKEIEDSNFPYPSFPNKVVESKREE